MAVRRPLRYNPGEGMIEMTESEVNAVSSRVLDLYVANNPVVLTHVSTGGNLGTITDTRKRASAVLTDNTDFLNPGAITDATPVDFSKIQQTLATVSTPTNPLPVYWDNASGITEMTNADFADTFLAYPFGLLTSGSVGNNSAGTYFISTANAVADATKIGNVFIDTRANISLYDQDDIPEARDQPTTITTYRLHRRDTFGTVLSYYTPFYIPGTTGIQRYTKPSWEAILIEQMRYHAVSTPGFRITYNINGSGTASGSAMLNTVTTGNTVGELQVNDDYKSQRFPSGGNTTADTYQFKIRLN